MVPRIAKKKTHETKVEAQVIEKPAVAEKKQDYIYAVGRRKSAIAKVRLLSKGKGEIIVSGKDYKSYFPYFEFQDIIVAPLKACSVLNNYDFSIVVYGGGYRGQAEAIRLGISRTLIKTDENLRKILKPLGYLHRNPRVKERKKPGLKRARRAPQWQKR